MPEELGSVSVSITADQTGLRSALQSAQATATKGGADISKAIANGAASGADAIKAQFAAAEQAVRTATKNMAEAQANFGSFAAAGSKEAAAALASYESELKQATVAQAALKAQLDMTRASAKAAHGELTQMQAVSGAIRVSEGSGALRAAERALTMIPGLGAAAQTIFPVVGAIAVGEAVFRMVEHLGKALNLWSGISEAEKKAAENAQRVGAEVQQLGEKLQAGQNRINEMTLGKTSAKALEQPQKLSMENAPRDAISMTSAQIAEEEEKIKGLIKLNEGLVEQGALSIESTIQRHRKALDGLRVDMQKAETQQAVAKQATRITALETIGLVLGDSQEQKNKATEAANRAAERVQAEMSAIRSANSTMLADLQADHAVTHAEETEFWQQRLAEVEQGGRRYIEIQREIGRTLGRLNQEILSERKTADDLQEKQVQAFAEKIHEFNLKMAKEELEYGPRAAKREATEERRQYEPKPEIAQVPIRGQGMLSGTALGQIEILKTLGVYTSQYQQASIAGQQKTLDMAQAVAIPLGTQLALRRKILEEQIALNSAQGIGADKELNEVASIEKKQKKMYDDTHGRDDLRRSIEGIGRQIPGAVGNAAAGAIVNGGNIGKEIKNSLKGIGQQLLGATLTAAIKQLIIKTGLETAATSALGVIFGTSSTTSAAAIVASNTASAAATTAAATAEVTAMGILTSSVDALTVAMSVNSIIPFANGGQPPVGVPSLVGERGPELFVPRTAGTIITAERTRSLMSAPSAPGMGSFAFAGAGGGSMSSVDNSSGNQSNTFHVHNARDARGVVREISQYLKSASPKFSPSTR